MVGRGVKEMIGRLECWDELDEFDEVDDVECVVVILFKRWSGGWDIVVEKWSGEVCGEWEIGGNFCNDY